MGDGAAENQKRIEYRDVIGAVVCMGRCKAGKRRRNIALKPGNIATCFQNVLPQVVFGENCAASAGDPGRHGLFCLLCKFRQIREAAENQADSDPERMGSGNILQLFAEVFFFRIAAKSDQDKECFMYRSTTDLF